jgi:hypothetical protein
MPAWLGRRACGRAALALEPDVLAGGGPKRGRACALAAASGSHSNSRDRPAQRSDSDGGSSNWAVFSWRVQYQDDPAIRAPVPLPWNLIAFELSYH